MLRFDSFLFLFCVGLYKSMYLNDGNYLSFPFGYRTPSSIFCKVCLEVMISLSLAFIYPSLLKDSYTGYSFLG
jgi:hypothetical protein